MDVYMDKFFRLKHATMDSLFSDVFLDDNRRLSRIIPAKIKAANDLAPIPDAARATKTVSKQLRGQHQIARDGQYSAKPVQNVAVKAWPAGQKST